MTHPCFVNLNEHYWPTKQANLFHRTSNNCPGHVQTVGVQSTYDAERRRKTQDMTVK